MKNRFNFTNINHYVRIELGLTMNEYAVAELIYHLANNPSGTGWCYASKETLGAYLGLSKQSVHKIINKLLELKLIERDEGTKHLRATKLWYDKVIVTNSKESLLPVNNVYSDSKESLLDDSKESLHNNNKRYIDIYNTVAKNGFLQKLPTINNKNDYVDYLSDEILKQLGDDHSKKFYRLVAKKVPERVIREALSEIKHDGARKPAAVFTDRMKSYAKSML